jgi:hypothetical protein
MRIGTKQVIAGIAGVTTVVALVLAYRANERRFRALEQRMRAVAEEARQTAADRSPTPIVVVPAPAAPSSAALTAQTEPAAAAGSENQTATPPPISDADQAAHVWTVFSQEGIDSAWAKQTEGAIGTPLRAIVESSSLDGLECRRTLCRASVRHQDQAKFSAFLDRVLAHANELWTGPVYSLRESVSPDGAIQNTIYFAKPGEEIPLLN